MHYYNSTQTPNELFDEHLPYLNQAQLKVLLVVIRQTLGWIDPKTKKRKRKDWISISFFKRKTGLSHKSISLAIAELIHNDLIVAMDYHENILKTPKDRRGKKKIYYSYAPYFWKLKRKTCVDMLVDLFTFQPKTKHTHTKKRNVQLKDSDTIQNNNSSSSSRLSDSERYKEIVRSQSHPLF